MGTVTYELDPEDVQWVVNSLGELGVCIDGKCFFLYKGMSLVYSNKDNLFVRPVFKREFGECCHPLGCEEGPGVSLDDSDEWRPL